MLFKNHAKSIVYGGLDGIITTFAVIAGSIGGNLGMTTIVILGFSNLLADGFSMAAGDYLSSTTEEGAEVKDAVMNAVMTFLSFNLFGLVPLFSYLLLRNLPVFHDYILWGASGLVSLALLALGYVKGRITGQPVGKEMLRTLTVGLIAAMVAYFVGQFLGNLV